MKEELIDPHVQFPGLQIFSSWKNSSKNIRSSHNASNRSTFNPQFLPSEETLASAVMNDNSPSQVGPWFKFSERKSFELHDYSPTVVDCDYFERNYASERPEKPSFWSKIIREIFKELPDSSNDQFIEEFQYTVISSDFLSDPHGYRFSFAGKKSIMDFHKRSASFHRQELATVPTKYGRLKISSSGRFTLVRTLDILSAFFASWRVLRFLKRCNVRPARCHRTLTSVLIVLYLAIQQEFFHTQYTRYKALITLKKTLASMQELSGLTHKYRIKLKELSIYKPLSTSLRNASPDPTMAKIKDILSSCLDLLYFKLRTMTENLLPLCSTASLAKYCAMYSLEMSDIFHFLKETAVEVEEKSERVSVMRKFSLCTLLSLCCCKVSKDESMIGLLSKIFPDSVFELRETSHLKDIDIYRMVTDNLQQMDEFVVQLTSSLVNHKYILHAYGDSLPGSAEDNMIQQKGRPSNQNRQLNHTLQSLKRLESFLIASKDEEVTKETRDIVTCRLQEIISAWQNYDKPKVHYKPSFSSSPNQGFSLNVLKNPSSPSIKATPKNGNICLEDKVAFERVDETQSDIESDSDHEHHISYDNICFGNAKSEFDDSIKTQGLPEVRHDLRELTDEELRRKLNERISKFAVENRQGREKLRTQKSFELLKKKEMEKESHRHASIMTKNSLITAKSRPPNESNISSEDSIPIFYELEELLEKKQ